MESDKVKETILNELTKIQDSQKQAQTNVEYFAKILEIYEDDNGFYIVYDVEHKQMTPLSRSEDFVAFDDIDIALIAKQLLRAGQLMKKLQIKLKNLKPNNIYMNEKDIQVSITNAGFSCLYEQSLEEAEED